ncbi:MAG: PAC2 family protein [Candidatus Woesearchaeota archaeon]
MKKKFSKKNPLEKTTRFTDWTITVHATPSIKNPLLIEGMPGIGNVGKIVMDILIEELHAVRLMTFFSRTLPNTVYVNEENLVDLPTIALYWKRINTKDYLFLTGDVQPTTEKSSYELSELILDVYTELCGTTSGRGIITLGGIGLSTVPEEPKIYLTGNSTLFLSTLSKELKQKKLSHETSIYGIVGPIMGVSGLLLGLARQRKILAASFLAETFGHPVYVGLKGARAILYLLNVQYVFGIKLERLDKEIVNIDNQIKGITRAGDSKTPLKYRKFSETNYIG